MDRKLGELNAFISLQRNFYVHEIVTKYPKISVESFGELDSLFNVALDFNKFKALGKTDAARPLVNSIPREKVTIKKSGLKHVLPRVSDLLGAPGITEKFSSIMVLSPGASLSNYRDISSAADETPGKFGKMFFFWSIWDEPVGGQDPYFSIKGRDRLGLTPFALDKIDPIRFQYMAFYADSTIDITSNCPLLVLTYDLYRTTQPNRDSHNELIHSYIDVNKIHTCIQGIMEMKKLQNNGTPSDIAAPDRKRKIQHSTNVNRIILQPTKSLLPLYRKTFTLLSKQFPQYFYTWGTIRQIRAMEYSLLDSSSQNDRIDFSSDLKIVEQEELPTQRNFGDLFYVLWDGLNSEQFFTVTTLSSALDTLKTKMDIRPSEEFTTFFTKYPSFSAQDAAQASVFSFFGSLHSKSFGLQYTKQFLQFQKKKTEAPFCIEELYNSWRRASKTEDAIELLKEWLLISADNDKVIVYNSRFFAKALAETLNSTNIAITKARNQLIDFYFSNSTFWMICGCAAKRKFCKKHSLENLEHVKSLFRTINPCDIETKQKVIQKISSILSEFTFKDIFVLDGLYTDMRTHKDHYPYLTNDVLAHLLSNHIFRSKNSISVRTANDKKEVYERMEEILKFYKEDPSQISNPTFPNDSIIITNIRQKLLSAFPLTNDQVANSLGKLIVDTVKSILESGLPTICTLLIDLIVNIAVFVFIGATDHFNQICRPMVELIVSSPILNTNQPTFAYFFSQLLSQLQESLSTFASSPLYTIIHDHCLPKVSLPEIEIPDIQIIEATKPKISDQPPPQQQQKEQPNEDDSSSSDDSDSDSDDSDSGIYIGTTGIAPLEEVVWKNPVCECGTVGCAQFNQFLLSKDQQFTPDSLDEKDKLHIAQLLESKVKLITIQLQAGAKQYIKKSALYNQVINLNRDMTLLSDTLKTMSQNTGEEIPTLFFESKKEKEKVAAPVAKVAAATGRVKMPATKSAAQTKPQFNQDPSKPSLVPIPPPKRPMQIAKKSAPLKPPKIKTTTTTTTTSAPAAGNGQTKTCKDEDHVAWWGTSVELPESEFYSKRRTCKNSKQLDQYNC
ncbi:hypothetical protein DFA_05817 [Cavenderia fasciculata]|uniref:Uncharacterized protein n=1 Tax=Cavenderia fasciculata TaxID=261658 RepID=F4PMT9_CACFS|nr:uncharacterized protein DFA_05817 [Cavenderia fasciculata]EGG23683.1 hypothetical protein DFA_05817 [Cavenderia fasciculata]|eukprot:XP_004361534.1 hypothetical protein DFA_05817 [Cavenderia fasciculata]